MKVQYLEIVTPDVETLCKVYETGYDVTFAAPNPMLGNARVAEMQDGGRVGIRAPMNDGETPVARPYFLVSNIEAAVKKAEGNGTFVMHPPLEIPGQGTFAICKTAEIEHGFWQL